MTKSVYSAGYETAKHKTSRPPRQVALAKEGRMRPSGISHILRVAMLGSGLFLVVSGAGLPSGSGVVQAQKTGQQKTTPYSQPSASGLDQPATASDPMHERMDEERMKSANDDRHKRLAADVDRLVSLTGELKSDVDKTTKDELSLEVIKKAQEIEKLAHDVQSRMKN
jgi:hypothetical protein